MDLYRVGMPDEYDIIVRDKFIVDEFAPLCLKKISDDQYSLLFYSYQHSTDASVFLQCIIKSDNTNDEGYLNSHPLNIINIQRENGNKLVDYNDKISKMSGNIFNVDFDMEFDEQNPRFFSSKAVKALDTKNGTRASLLDLYITRDNFIKINIFFARFLKREYDCEGIFTSKKVKNLEFLKIDYIKLNGSCTDKINKLTYSNYTVGNGPTSYNFNFISPAIKDRQLINPVLPETYEISYKDDFIIKDIIKDNHRDVIYVLYEIRNSITYLYIKTIIFVLNKDIYSHSNLVELDKIYEKNKNNNTMLTI